MCSLNSNQPSTPQIQFQIYHGIFLDPASSAVYGVFLFIGAYVFGAMRAHFPSLTLLSIFGLIILDMVCHIWIENFKDIDHIIDLYYWTP